MLSVLLQIKKYVVFQIDLLQLVLVVSKFRLASSGQLQTDVANGSVQDGQISE